MISSENIIFCTKKTTALTSIFDVILICQTLQKWKQIGKMKSKIVWKNHLEFFKYFLCQEMNKIINSWKHSSNGKKWFKTNDYVLRWHYSQVNIERTVFFYLWPFCLLPWLAHMPQNRPSGPHRGGWPTDPKFFLESLGGPNR